MIEEHEPYLRAWRARDAESAGRARELASRARGIAERLARTLRGGFGARRVWLIGSTCIPESFKTTSDIDLVVEGLPIDQLFRAGADLERDAEGFRVDLIPFESATPGLLSILKAEGILLE
ncbi:MAG: hypothetical protein SFV15_18545 [Polyangiaceae bacterium]|nr:hypothetical protein [Polyangiaceae bacterium]